MEYLDYYGLDFDPFELPVDSLFSNAGGRVQLLEKVEHLVAFSDLNIFIYGQQGIGKTNFLKHLMVTPSAMWRSIYIPVMGEFKFDDILELILSEYHLTLTKNSSLSTVAAEISEVLQSSNQSVLLLCFDDAHLLSPEIFDQYLKLKFEFEKFDIQIKGLFTGEQNELEQNCDFSEDTNQSYQLFLESLTLDDTKAYLTTYFQKAGKSDKLPIGSADIKRIFEMSQGIPQKINHITPEYLLQNLDQPTNKMNLSFLKVGAGLVSLVLLIGLFYFKQSQDSLESNNEIVKEELPVLEVNHSVMDKLQQASDAMNDIQKSDAEQVMLEVADDVDDLDGFIEITETQEKAVQEKILIVTDSQDEDDLPKAEEALVEKVLSDDVVVFSEVDSEKVNADTVVVTPEVKEYAVINDWFRANSGWVLQVLGSHNEKNVDEFILNYPEMNWRKYQRILNDKDYFVVVISGFESKAQASQLLAEAPAEIKQLSPWNRSIESIRPLLDH